MMLGLNEMFNPNFDIQNPVDILDPPFRKNKPKCNQTFQANLDRHLRTTRQLQFPELPNRSLGKVIDLQHD